jgi:hypothetical protein
MSRSPETDLAGKAAAGDTRAMVELGQRAEDGRDFETAFAWYAKAYAAGYEEGAVRTEMLSESVEYLFQRYVVAIRSNAVADIETCEADMRTFLFQGRGGSINWFVESLATAKTESSDVIPPKWQNLCDVAEQFEGPSASAIHDALACVPRCDEGFVDIAGPLLDWVVENAALAPEVTEIIAALESDERGMFNAYLFDWLNRIEATD